MANEESGLEYILDEDLGDNGGVLRARKVEELEAWVQTEQEFWDWLNHDSVRNIRTLQSVANRVANVLKQFRSNLDLYKTGSDPETHLNNIRSIVDEQYRNRAILHSSTPEAGFIDRLREDAGDVEAAAALSRCIGTQWDINDSRQFRGAVALVVFQEGATPKTTPAVRRSLKKLADEYSARYAEDTAAADLLRDRLQGLVEKLQGLVEKHSTLQERGIRDMANAVRQARRQAAAQRAEATQRLAEFENLYNAKLALDAPVKYWRSKRIKHRIAGGVFFVAFVAYIAGALWLVAQAIRDTRLGSLDYWQSADLTISALTVVVVGVVAALARVLLRLAMSQLHLGNDADERVTMVNTYLALRQGEHANEQHMQIVLERLFAPAADGIVKDDLGPVTMVEAVKSALTRK